MRITQFASSIFATALACTSFAASPSEQSSRIEGYMDLRTGVFHSHPTPRASVDEFSPEAAPSAVMSGEFKITFDIKLDPTLPSTDAVSCQIGVEAEDAGTYATYVDNVTTPAKRTGSTATCSGVIEYEWPVLAPKSTVFIYGSAVAGPAATARTATRNLASVAVPANGATTTLTYNFFL